MHTVGRRKEMDVCEKASGKLLLEGARFNEEMQKIQSTFRFPKGVFHYKTHEDANVHMIEAVVASMVAVHEKRST